jgi:hypothetical protein
MSRANNNDTAIRGGSRRSEVACLLQGVWRIQGAGVKCSNVCRGCWCWCGPRSSLLRAGGGDDERLKWDVSGLATRTARRKRACAGSGLAVEGKALRLNNTAARHVSGLLRRRWSAEEELQDGSEVVRE